MRPFPEGEENAIDKAKAYPQLVEDPQPLHEIIDLPQLLERVVLTCLARDPARRPGSALETAIALETVLETLGTEELFAWPKGLRVRPPAGRGRTSPVRRSSADPRTLVTTALCQW